MRTSKLKPSKRGISSKTLNQLTTQQQIFIKELLASKDFNASEAARKAGYKHPGTVATKLLNNKLVAAAIGKAIYERSAKLDITAERVLQELARIAFVNPQEMFTSQGTLLEISAMSEDTARAISGFDVEVRTTNYGEEETVTTTIKPRMWNKLEALKLLMAHLGLTLPGDKLKLEGSVNFIAQAIHKIESSAPKILDTNVIEAVLENVQAKTEAAK